jgi:hypothetical protein
LRLVLAEAGSYGMHGSVLVVLDDIAAMLGCYDPIPEPAAAHVAGPMVNWRTHPGQPTFERIEDVEKLALKQRALIAFGGYHPGEMCGRAEIVVAMGNILQGESPPEYYDVFQWASLDVLSTITGHSPEQILKDPGKKHWRAIDDDEVTRPGGRLYATYQTICTSIRRDSIAAMKANPEHPRAYLLPFARLFLAANVEARQPAEADDDRRMLLAIDDSTRTILTMFPELADTMDVPLVEQALASV